MSPVSNIKWKIVYILLHVYQCHSSPMLTDISTGNIYIYKILNSSNNNMKKLCCVQCGKYYYDICYCTQRKKNLFLFVYNEYQTFRSCPFAVPMYSTIQDPFICATTDVIELCLNTTARGSTTGLEGFYSISSTKRLSVVIYITQMLLLSLDH